MEAVLRRRLISINMVVLFLFLAFEMVACFNLFEEEDVTINQEGVIEQTVSKTPVNQQ